MKTRTVVYSIIVVATLVVAYMRLTHTPPPEQTVNLDYYVPKSEPGKPQMEQMMDPAGGAGGGSSNVKSPTVVDIYNKDKGPNAPKAPPKTN